MILPANSKRRDFMAISLSLGATCLGLWPLTSDAQMIREMRGQVRINQQVATLDTQIQAGDHIRTGPDSAIVFVIAGDAYRLGANAHLQLELNHDDGLGLLRLVSGALLGVFSKGDKELHTPAAVIGIRGTGIFLEVQPAQTYFCTCFGHTTLDASRQPSQHISAQHHQAKLISHTVYPSVSEGTMQGSEEGHNDAEIRRLAQLTGINLPTSFHA